MTRAEMEAKAIELRNKVEAQVKAYNEAMLESKFDEAAKIDAETSENINEYTGIVRTMEFQDIAATADPMVEACKRLTFMTIATKDVKVGEDKIPVREVVNRERQIDPFKLHKFVEGGIGHDKEWHYIAEKMNYLMTLQCARDLGIDPKEVSDSYAISRIAREYDMGKNPTSKTNMLKTLTKTVQAMIGEEYKPKSHDVNFLLRIYSRKSHRALTVTCANHKYMRLYIMEICHRILEEKEYGVDYKKNNG